MSTSGMRYKKVMELVDSLEEKRTAISSLLDTIENDRSAEVARVYDGAAAENFKSNMRTVATVVNTEIKSMVEQLKTEAEIQLKAYKSQEQNLQSNINIG